MQYKAHGSHELLKNKKWCPIKAFSQQKVCQQNKRGNYSSSSTAITALQNRLPRVGIPSRVALGRVWVHKHKMNSDSLLTVGLFRGLDVKRMHVNPIRECSSALSQVRACRALSTKVCRRLCIYIPLSPGAEPLWLATLIRLNTRRSENPHATGYQGTGLACGLLSLPSI